MLASPAVTIRAFRGARRSSVYREHVVSGAVFARILAAGKQRELAALASLDSIGAHEVDKREARQLADEVGLLRERSELPDLDGDLTAFAFVARWCARASGKAWLTIEER